MWVDLDSTDIGISRLKALANPAGHPRLGERHNNGRIALLGERVQVSENAWTKLSFIFAFHEEKLVSWQNLRSDKDVQHFLVEGVFAGSKEKQAILTAILFVVVDSHFGESLSDRRWCIADKIIV